MRTLCLVGYELRRILLTRAFFYGLLLLLLFSQDVLRRLIIEGTYGAAPYSPLSYAQFLVLLNPLLMGVLMLWCAGVVSERQQAVRRIVLSTPITPAGYLGIQVGAIGLAFLISSGLVVAASLVFYGWQFGFYGFREFLSPILAFWLPAAVFALGVGVAAGQIHPRLVLALLPLLFFAGVFNLGLPSWLDICGNNFMLDYPKILMRTLGTGDMVYYLPSGFLASRVGLLVAGVLLLGWAARRCSR